MRKLAGLAILFFFLSGTGASAAGPGINAPVLLHPAASPLVAPQIALSPTGQVRVAWAADDTIQIAEPDGRWRAADIPLESGGGRQTALDLNWHSLAWSQTLSGTMLVTLQTSDGTRPATSLRVSIGAIFTAASSGQMYAAWAGGTSISFLDSATVITRTVELSATASRLHISADAAGNGYLVWQQESADVDINGIYLLALKPAEVPRRIAPLGAHPQLAPDVDGILHAAYFVTDTLVYASNADWQRLTSVADGLDPNVPFALALGPDGNAHLAWYQDGRIMSASSADWTFLHTLQNLPDTVLEYLDLAVDARGIQHVVYAMPSASGVDIYYAHDADAILQVRLSSDLDAQVLTSPYTVTAITNRLPAEILRVQFFLSPDSKPGDERIRIPQAADTDGSDGWSAVLDAPNAVPERVQACALATAADGSQAEICSGSFTLIPADWPDVWLDSSPSLAGEPIVYAYVNPQNASKQIDLYAQPWACTSGALICPADGLVQYLGRFTLPRAPQGAIKRQMLRLNTEQLADGMYRISAALVSEEGVFTNTLSIPVLVQHTVLPSIQLQPIPSLVHIGEMLEIQPQVEQGRYPLARIDYRLVREQPVLASRPGLAPVESAETMWLGSSTAEQGWKLRVPIQSTWLGDGWRVQATLYDAHGLSATHLTTSRLTIERSGTPQLDFMQPLQNEIISGTTTIVVTPGIPLSPTATLDLYIQGAAGDWSLLGALQRDQDSWIYELDTHRLVNGEHSLLAIVQQDGIISPPAALVVNINNPPAGYTTLSPLSGSVVDGSVPIIISPTIASSKPVTIQMFLQAADSSYWYLGEAVAAAGRYGILWNSRTVLDGTYTLHTVISEPDGPNQYMEQVFAVDNASMQVALDSTGIAGIQRGVRQVCWGPAADEAVDRVALAFSPDDGQRWVDIADNLAPAGCYNWDTRRMPDTSTGRLRLDIQRGTVMHSDISRAFMIDNEVESPLLTLISPRSSDTLAKQVRIAWQSWNPDEGNIYVNISYRPPQGDWISLAINQPANGEYIWDTSAVAANSCDLRISAYASSGRIAVAIAEELVLAKGDPLSVRLFAPLGNEIFTDEVLILWNVPSAFQKQVSIDLYFSDNAGLSWLPLAEGLANTSYYQWQVSFLPPGDQYRVKVVGRTANERVDSVSANTFTIGAPSPPAIDLLQPLTGADLHGLEPVQWRIRARTRNVYTTSLAVRPVGETSWSLLSAQTPLDGFYLWDTGVYPDGTYEIRLRAQSSDSAEHLETSTTITVSNQTNHPPHLSLVSPDMKNASSSLLPLYWQANDLDGDPLQMQLSIRDSRGVETGSIYALPGLYLWEPGDASQPYYRVRLEASDGTAQGSVMTTITAPVRGGLSFTLLSDPAAVLESGALRWVAEDALGQVYPVSVFISADFGATWRPYVLDTLESHLRLDIAAFEPGVRYLVKLQARGMQETLALPVLSLLRPPLDYQEPRLEVQLPQETVTWSAQHEIIWQTDDPLGRNLQIQIDVSRDGGLSWESLASNAESTGTFTFDTRQVANGLYLLRVRADNGKVSTSRVSAPIQIINPGNDRPLISLLQPEAGEVWSGVRTLRWVTSATAGNPTQVSLFASIDQGRAWQTLASALPDSGSFVIDTTSLPNTEQLWLKALVTDGTHFSQDILDGSLAVQNVRNPVIRLISASAAAYNSRVIELAWKASTTDSLTTRVTLSYSIDGGLHWTPIASRLPASGTYRWGTFTLQDGTPIWLRAQAENNQGIGIATSRQPIVLDAHIPAFGLPYLP